LSAIAVPGASGISCRCGQRQLVLNSNSRSGCNCSGTAWAGRSPIITTDRVARLSSTRVIAWREWVSVSASVP